MGKRSNFERVDRDFYPTPKEAVLPLLPHLNGYTCFAEPCAGAGDLVYHIVELSEISCNFACDVEPKADFIHKVSALKQEAPFEWICNGCGCIITNPPWDRKILHPMIEHFRQFGDTWLLFDADWMHTKQSSEYMKFCHKVVSVGRVKWIPDSKMTGKDNCAWYLFRPTKGETKFFGR